MHAELPNPRITQLGTTGPPPQSTPPHARTLRLCTRLLDADGRRRIHLCGEKRSPTRQNMPLINITNKSQKSMQLITTQAQSAVLSAGDSHLSRHRMQSTAGRGEEGETRAALAVAPARGSVPRRFRREPNESSVLGPENDPGLLFRTCMSHLLLSSVSSTCLSAGLRSPNVRGA